MTNDGAAKLTQHFRPPGSTPSLEITKQYITRVLPPPGDAYINVHYTFMPKGGLRPEQYKLPITGRAYKTVDEAIEGIAYRQGRSDTRDMWVCMTTQREAQETTDKTGRRKYLKAVRLAENAVAVKALWFDLDVEAGNPKKYDTIEAAAEGLAKFLIEAKLPKPTVIVQSGAGIHGYWTFDRAITPQEWYALACALTAAGDKHGLKFDRITTDAARLLRLPGTLNYKTDPPRPVTMKSAGKDYTVNEITKALEPYKVQATFMAGNDAYAFVENPAEFPRRQPITGKCDLSAGIEIFMPRDQVRMCLEAIPNDKVDWNFWNTVGMRVFAATEGADYGLEEWRAWSDKNKTIANATDNCDARWATLHTSPPNRTGAGALINQAREALGDPTWLPHPEPITPKGNAGHGDNPSTAWDPLDFIMTTTDDAVRRINTEYFFRRDTSEICRQDATTGEIQVLTLQQLKTALAGRWVNQCVARWQPRQGRQEARVSLPFNKSPFRWPYGNYGNYGRVIYSIAAGR